MKNILLLIALLCEITPVFSQNHATCEDAIPVTTSSYGPVNARDLSDPSLCVPSSKNMYLSKSHLVVWFSFVVPYDTTLTFQIVPETPTDDFDFMLFKADGKDFCEKEKQRKVQPIRTNFSKSTSDNKGVTGLSEEATEIMVAPGFNSPYSAALEVKKGEVYYLAVNNYTDNKDGFFLKIPFQFNAIRKTIKAPVAIEPVKAPPVAIAPPHAAVANFFIHVLDSANHPVKANLILDDSIKQDNSITVDTSDYSLLLKKHQTIKIRANATGHMPYQSSYTAVSDTSAATILVHLQPIKSANKITLKDIQFENDSPNILGVSNPALEYVLKFMLSNPTVKVIIKGYANDPKHVQTERYDQALSEARTNSVKKYLVSNGVDKKRMQCVGYGSTQMLYPHPINEDQKAANRRVEIEIQ